VWCAVGLRNETSFQFYIAAVVGEFKYISVSFVKAGTQFNQKLEWLSLPAGIACAFIPAVVCHAGSKFGVLVEPSVIVHNAMSVIMMSV
jgi:hypothetical protein